MFKQVFERKRVARINVEGTADDLGLFWPMLVIFFQWSQQRWKNLPSVIFLADLNAPHQAEPCQKVLYSAILWHVNTYISSDYFVKLQDFSQVEEILSGKDIQ